MSLKVTGIVVGNKQSNPRIPAFASQLHYGRNDLVLVEQRGLESRASDID